MFNLFWVSLLFIQVNGMPIFFNDMHSLECIDPLIFNMTYDKYIRQRVSIDNSVLEYSRGYILDNSLTPEPIDTIIVPMSTANISIDYTHCTPPVKNQLLCGACAVFSSLDAIASIKSCLHNEPIQNFSVQEVIDCQISPNKICANGTHPYNVYKYLVKKMDSTQGLKISPIYSFNQTGMFPTTDELYPYTQADGLCNKNLVYDTISSKYIISNFKLFKVETYQDLAYLLHTYGPVVVSIKASCSKLYSYSKSEGPINHYICGASGYNDHAVLLIGYDGTYFKYKNSWGSTWGDNGYFYVAKDTKPKTLGFLGELRDGASVFMLSKIGQ